MMDGVLMGLCVMLDRAWLSTAMSPRVSSVQLNSVPA